MNLITLVLVVMLVVILLGGWSWGAGYYVGRPYHAYGAGIGGVVLWILLIMLILGRA